MAEKQSTFGKFIDLLTKFADETGDFDTQFIIEELIARAPEEQKKQWHSVSLTAELVLDTAEVVASFFRGRLEGICTENYYSQTLDAGHTLLCEIHQKATELGVSVDLNAINLPLTPSDLLVFSGLAERRMVDGHYEIKLKEKGGGAKMAKKQIIKITNVPEGPGIPEEIRKGWIGTFFEAEGPIEMVVGSALVSDECHGIKRVYKVPSGLALAALKLQNSKSWEWFKNQPRLAPIFAFNTECCEVVSQ